MDSPPDPISEWKSIPDLVERAIAGRSEQELDQPADPAMTLRELVHHVVEANVVAASIIIAACGSPGSTYDWSWMMPFGPWLDRMDYRRKPIEPALRLLHTLNAYVASQLEPLEGALEREVWLRDAPDAGLRRAAVRDVLLQEVGHAREHFERAPS